jgi:predicted small lipoprotein YifL
MGRQRTRCAATVASFRSFLLLAAVWGLAGCGGSTPSDAPSSNPDGPAKPAPADPDDVPITEADVARPRDYPDAVARIEGYRDTIRDEIAAGRPAKAHRALDELDIVLNWLPGVARDGAVAKERWEDVNTTAQEIRGLFNQVHSRIDAKQDPDYASVSEAIDRAIEKLKGITPAVATGDRPAGPEGEGQKP